jgi:hypothetical protein
LSRDLDRFFAVAGFTHDLDIRAYGEQRVQSFAEQGLIVNE